MKKVFSVTLAFMIMIFSAQAKAADVVIDYGDSKIFSQEDMDFCIEIIKYELKRSKCTLHNVRYEGDSCNSRENIKYLNSLAESRNFKKKFTKCMVFKTDYRSPPDDGKISAWNYDSEYTDYSWWFGFYDTDKSWKLLTSGY